MVVSPVGGTVHRAEVAEGATVRAGTPLGAVRTRQDDQPVLASYAGTLVEWLVENGDLVDAGDPLARLEPGSSN
ncbi:MAG TPA: biotin/lipoyl-binding protein [Mycobacteriales bacterium]|nr:biotin/lipoyl-binding protein [Mycobacteriales bacterium]